MNTRQKLTDMAAFMREIPEQFRIARRGAITAIAQHQSIPPNPLGTVSHTAPAEGQGAHPGGVIRGRTPCATTPPRRDVPPSANHLIEALLDERDRYRTALTVIADNPCATGCDERLGTEDGQWCISCAAREALNHD